MMTRRSPKQPGSRTFAATDQFLIVGQRKLPIRELHNLRVTQAEPSRLPIAVAFAATVFPLVSLFSGVRDVTSWAAVALITASILAVAAVLQLRAQPLRILYADHHGRYADEVFVSRDARVFGQVTRAVQRASELHRGRERLAPSFRVSSHLPAPPLVSDAAQG